MHFTLNGKLLTLRTYHKSPGPPHWTPRRSGICTPACAFLPLGSMLPPLSSTAGTTCQATLLSGIALCFLWSASDALMGRIGHPWPRCKVTATTLAGNSSAKIDSATLLLQNPAPQPTPIVESVHCTTMLNIHSMHIVWVYDTMTMTMRRNPTIQYNPRETSD